MAAKIEELLEYHTQLQGDFRVVMDGEDSEIIKTIGDNARANRDKQNGQRRMGELSGDLLGSLQDLCIHNKAVLEALIELEELTDQVFQRNHTKNIPDIVGKISFRDLIEEKRNTFLSALIMVSHYADLRGQLGSAFPIEKKEGEAFGSTQKLLAVINPEVSMAMNVYRARSISGKSNILSQLCPELAPTVEEETLSRQFNLIAEVTCTDLFKEAGFKQSALANMIVLYDFLKAFKEGNPAVEDIECEDIKDSLLTMMDFLHGQMVRFLDLSSRVGGELEQVTGVFQP